MSFVNKLNDTYELLSKFDDIIMKDNDNDIIRKKLLSVSEDLAEYKDLDKTKINFQSDEIQLKINDILNRVDEIETNIRNKLIIAQKYSVHINS